MTVITEIVMKKSNEYGFLNSCDQLTEAEVERQLMKCFRSDEDKEQFIFRLGNDDIINSATPLELRLYRRFTDELCEKDNPIALKCKGYSCYGGDRAYDCDWETSRQCIEKLLKMTGDPMYANTLGYIYYYGRCNNGVPQYEEAFKYFSIGAAGGFYESRYKIADMFLNGYGVTKSERTAMLIMNELYDENKKYMLDGAFECKFADIALRMGDLAQAGLYGYPNEEIAYFYYLQADLAIRSRAKYNLYGDGAVAEKISKALSVTEGKVKKKKDTAQITLFLMLHDYLKEYRKLQMSIKKLKNGDLKLSIRIAKFKHETDHPKMLVTNTETRFCGFLEKLTIRVKKANIANKYISKKIYFDNIIGDTFMLGDKVTAVISGKYYFSDPVKKSKKKYRFASVYFSPGGKLYDYLLDIDGVSVGDSVIVSTKKGETSVTVADISKKSESELSLPFERYKRIIRKK